MLSEVNPYVTITPLGPARNILYQVLNFEVFTICEKEECGILERGADIQAFCLYRDLFFKLNLNIWKNLILYYVLIFLFDTLMSMSMSIS